MHSSALDHLITDDEVARFERDGFLVLPGLLGHDEIARLTAAIDRFTARVPPNQTSSWYNFADILTQDDEFLDLVDHPRVLPKVLGLIGFNIRINHSHINIDRPKPDDEAFTWHKDGAMVHWDLPMRPIPAYAVKAAFFLTGLETDAYGNTFIMPGSHRQPHNNVPKHGTRPAEAVPLIGPPGTVMLFDPRIAHCRSPNHSDRVRTGVFMQWGFRWLQPLDPMRVESLQPRVADPVRRQLLGFSQSVTPAGRSGAWYPSESDVPLRAWVLENARERAEKVCGRLLNYPAGWSTQALPRKPSEYARG